MNKKSFVTKHKYSLLRLTVNSKHLQDEKNHLIEISIKENLKNIQKLNFKIKVHSASIPELIDSNFFYTNWFNITKMEEKHSLKRWSDKWYKMLKKYEGRELELFAKLDRKYEQLARKKKIQENAEEEDRKQTERSQNVED